MINSPFIKRRIIFVDDEPFVLQGLQRTLRGMRDEWDMEFVESGSKALSAMSERRFDIIVSDMRMPEMNGAQLLNEVMKHYPRTVRLILSGNADKDLIMRCVGSTHQFLAKPCDLEALKLTVRRVSELESALQNDAIRTIVARLTKVPSLPSLYFDIVEKLQEPNVMIDEIGALISRDVGMTANILKLVNSAYFGMARRISDTTEATRYLGVETIKTLVLSIEAFSQFENSDLGGLSLKTVWDHSIRTAALAKSIAASVSNDRKLAEEAFVAGLLHDIGKIILGANQSKTYPTALSMAQSQRIPLWEAERLVFCVDHADVGGYLLGLWGLPIPVVEAAALHHAPCRATKQPFSPLTAVHLANAIGSDALFASITCDSSKADSEYIEKLGLSSEFQQWREEFRFEMGNHCNE
jgi:putative nucleotidyltransferase with HDIG domain